ncbi:MAG: beta-ribofuranosylaminobenzene 5'-phosphate synthase family protein [Candidatus Hadarchaeaceae archaeon]
MSKRDILRIHIKTPSRLHFGIIDLSRSLGRSYGSVGLAIEGPGYEILAEKSEELEVIGLEKDAERARKIAEKIIQIYNIPRQVKMNILESIPMHVGLGSTTQLTLAVATAITKLYGVKVSPVRLAEKMGRGKNSGVGTYAFVRGGFIVDGGVKEGRFPPLIFRYDFPEEWHFVIVTQEIERGLDEKTEEGLFKQITASSDIARRICHSLVMKMLPSIVERDIESFGQVLTEVQRLVGEAFSPYQGGVFGSKVASDIVERMLKDGAYGAGQSSWGPTVYGLVGGKAQAEELKEIILDFLKGKNYKASLRVVRPNNRGAKVQIKA